MKPAKAVVLAAGRGTRLQTEGCDLPKVMRRANGAPLLHYVLQALSFLPAEDIVLVVGYGKEQVTTAFPGYPFAVQAQQLGTGDAVKAAFAAFPGYEGDLLVCCGDMPLIRRETYEALLQEHRGGTCTILCGTTELPLPYGRILRNENGGFAAIVEEKDCTPAQRSIQELNSGVYVFDAAALAPILARLECGNAQSEYYLTDAPGLLRAEGRDVRLCRRALGTEIIGVNTLAQLADVERILQERRP